MEDDELMRTAISKAKGKQKAKRETDDKATRGRSMLPSIVVKSKLRCRPPTDTVVSPPAATTSRPEPTGKNITRSKSRAQPVPFTKKRVGTQPSVVRDESVLLEVSSAGGQADTRESSPNITDAETPNTADEELTAVDGDPMRRPDRSSVNIVPPADEDHIMHDMTADMDATGDGTGKLDVTEQSNVQVNIDSRAEVNLTVPPAVQQQELPLANFDLTGEHRLTGLEQRVDLLEQRNTVLNGRLEATSASLRVSQLQLTEVTRHLATMMVVYEGLCRTYVSNDPMFPAPVASQSNITLPPGVGWQQVADEIIHSGVFASLSHQSHHQQVAGTLTHPSDSASAIMGVAGRTVSVEQQRQADILAGQDYYSILAETQGSVPMLNQPVPPSPTANISLPAASTDQMVTTTSSRASAPPGMAITMSPSSLGRSSSFPGAPAGTNVPGLSDSSHQPCAQQ
ncbi:uncharacterized protein HD556DRAFT_1448751 [Suillus plorans]|uniref:Uncharacterized protein n=1 Tax=Suillus plorans TaxID=116603 RepID=A0A9P7ADZ6_9AGAM|nr:uncharacterized protein HD556DRAFT_1448751 [Suillus plorans]KAG1787415.1 hypothetical protein HD556DRAFT_1448751 [Suillus plorans]